MIMYKNAKILKLVNKAFEIYGYPDFNKMFQGGSRMRELVRIRDNHTCMNCKKPWAGGRRFDVHHLNGQCGKKTKSYDRPSEFDGLITLCHKCHFNHPTHTLKSRCA